MLSTHLQHIISPDILAGLADDNHDGVVDAEVIEAAYQAALREIREQVTIPEGELPGALQDIAATLTIERLYERRREVPPNVWRERAARARVLLAEIASGTRSANGTAAIRHNLASEDRVTRREVLDHL